MLVFRVSEWIFSELLGWDLKSWFVFVFDVALGLQVRCRVLEADSTFPTAHGLCQCVHHGLASNFCCGSFARRVGPGFFFFFKVWPKWVCKRFG